MNATEPLRLTKLAKRAGCAAKHPPGFLLPLLGMLPPVTDANVMVGSSTADDAAISKLSIVGFPDSLPATVLGEILAGACEIASDAGIAIVGGHTIKSEEPIFGLAVVGTVHPNRVLSNAGAKPGDALILTKPLGLGIISTASKNAQDAKGAITEAIRVMTTLNRAGAEVLTRFDVHALTDIT